MKKLLLSAVLTILLLTACGVENTNNDNVNTAADYTATTADDATTTTGSPAGTQYAGSPQEGIEITWHMFYLTFEEALYDSTDVVIANYVGHRLLYEQTLIEFEFSVLDRIQGNAADTIFAYAHVRNHIWDMPGTPTVSTFTEGTDYLLVLWRGLEYSTYQLHPDGFVIVNNLIIDLDNPTKSTMYGEPLSLHATELDFNSNSLERGEIIAFIAEATANNQS